MDGYIKLYRRFTEASFYKNPVISRVALHCLLRANFRDKKSSVKYQEVVVCRGQLLTGRETLARELGLSRQNIRTALVFLKKAEFLTIEPTHHYSVITIIKYEDYQGVPENQPTNQPTSNPHLTHNQPTSNPQVTTTKEVKNLRSKERKKRSKDSPEKASPAFPDTSPEIRLGKYLFEKLQTRNPKEKKPNFQRWGMAVDLMLREDNRTIIEIQQVIDWCQADEFWRNNIASTEKLRKQFDTLWRQMEAGPKQRLKIKHDKNMEVINKAIAEQTQKKRQIKMCRNNVVKGEGNYLTCKAYNTGCQFAHTPECNIDNPEFKGLLNANNREGVR